MSEWLHTHLAAVFDEVSFAFQRRQEVSRQVNRDGPAVCSLTDLRQCLVFIYKDDNAPVKTCNIQILDCNNTTGKKNRTLMCRNHTQQSLPEGGIIILF